MGMGEDLKSVNAEPELNEILNDPRFAGSTAWVIRAVVGGRNVANEWHKNSHIGLGTKGLGDLKGLRLEAIHSRVSGRYPAMTKPDISRTVSSLNHFVNGMKENDLVVIPDEATIYFGIIESGYFYKEEEEKEASGLPHQRTIKPMAVMGRKELSVDLRKALRVQYPVASLRAHTREILALTFGRIYRKEREAVSNKMVEVTYPLRRNLNIRFSVPDDITAEEARRLGTFCSSLYFKY